MSCPSDVRLDNDLDHLDWMFDGYASLLNGSKESFDAMTGNEAYYALHYDANQYAGTENKFTDGIKKAAQALYNSITTMLKRISEYFFGDGEKAAEAASDNAEKTVDALMKMDGNTPIPEDSPARNPEALVKSLEGGVEYEEVKEENSDLDRVITSVKSAAEKVKSAATVGQLRQVYGEIQKNANVGIQVVGKSLKTTLGKANTAAQKLRSAKVPGEDDAAEVKTAIKQENQEAADEAKDETKKARIIGGVRNKLVATLTAMTANAKGLKEKPVESSFKG